MIKNTVPIQRLQKGNAKWTLWPRTSYCMAPSWVDPTGCTSEPLTRFQRYANKKVGGPPPDSVAAATAADCATACVREGLDCLLLTYNANFRRCTCTEIEWTIRQEF